MSDQVRENLLKEFEYYLENQLEMIEKFDGRVIVLKDNQVIGDYATVPEAVYTTRKEHLMGTFLVQRVSEGTKDYTVKLGSGVSAP